MVSPRVSYSNKENNDAHVKLIKMVNDQRARCKLSALNEIVNKTRHTWVQLKIEQAQDFYIDLKDGELSEGEMKAKYMRSPTKNKSPIKERSPKKDQLKQQTTRKASNLKASPSLKAIIYKNSRIPKASTPPKRASSPKKPSASVSSRDASPRSSTSTKVAQRDSTSSRGTLVDRPLEAISINTNNKVIETASTHKAQVKMVPVVNVEHKEAVPVQMTMPEDKENQEESVTELAEKVDAEPKQSSRKRKSEDELEEGSRKRSSPSAAQSAVVEEEEKTLSPAKKESPIVIEDTVEEADIATEVETKEEAVAEPVVVVDQEEDEDSLMLEGDEDSMEVSRVVTERIEVDTKMEEQEEEAVDSKMEERENEVGDDTASIDSAIEALELESIRIKAERAKSIAETERLVRESLRKSGATTSSNESKTARSDDVFSEGEAEPVPSSSSGSTAPKPSLRERIDRFRAIFSPAARPASSIPRLSPPKYMQSPPRPQLSNIAKPIAKSVAVKPIESKAAAAKPVVARGIERFEPKTTAKAIEKPVEGLKEKFADKPVAKVATKPSAAAAPSMALASPPKSPAKRVSPPAASKMTKRVSPPAVSKIARLSPPAATKRVSPPPTASKIPRVSPTPAASKIARLSPPAVAKTVVRAPSPSTHPFSSAATTLSHTTKTGSSTAQHLPVKVVAPVRGSSIQIAASGPVRKSTQIKTAPNPVKVAPSHAASAISMANPFQKAQQQQQQQALASTSQLRTAKQTAAPIVSNAAYIELEEPDSAYSDSDDEETIQKRKNYQPWATKEALAAALEAQAHIDPDMIFGIPLGPVDLDEMFPVDSEQARVRRLRPRSSSGCWDRDGLTQFEIDSYNQRMGIQGPGYKLPVKVRDDGSGTPNRANRLSAIAQSAVSQGQVSRKPSYTAQRGSMSPVRSGSVLSTYANSTLAPSTIKYPQHAAGTPNRTKSAMANTASSSQKAKMSKPPTSASVSSNKQTKAAPTKNPFQNGTTSTLQSTSRLASGVAKATIAKK